MGKKYSDAEAEKNKFVKKTNSLEETKQDFDNAELESFNKEFEHRKEEEISWDDAVNALEEE